MRVENERKRVVIVFLIKTGHVIRIMFLLGIRGIPSKGRDIYRIIERKNKDFLGLNKKVSKYNMGHI